MDTEGGGREVGAGGGLAGRTEALSSGLGRRTQVTRLMGRGKEKSQNKHTNLREGR